MDSFSAAGRIFSDISHHAGDDSKFRTTARRAARVEKSLLSAAGSDRSKKPAFGKKAG